MNALQFCGFTLAVLSIIAAWIAFLVFGSPFAASLIILVAALFIGVILGSKLQEDLYK